jgi:uncharacterized membrane protein
VGRMRISLAAVPIMHILLYIVVGLNIPIIRQIIVFIYLSFIPGFVLLKILKLKETSVVDVLLFSMGLSIAFLMFAGLVISELYPILGISQPLSALPLEISLSFLTLILFFAGYKQELTESISSLGRSFEDSTGIIVKSAILFLPAILGVIGALFVSVPSVSVPIILLMFVAIASLFAISVFSGRLVSPKLYPVAIFAFSVALAFQVLFISRFIVGYDANLEYYVFKSTMSVGYWHPLSVIANSSSTVNLNSMLSVTVLPAIYFALMNINGEIVFKTVYPFVFSLVPVVLYRIYEKQIGKTKALLSALFFVSGPEVFYAPGTVSINRQIVAEFFLALSIFILLNEKIPVGKRRLLFIVFGAALVVSHYSTAYLYLVFVTSVYAVSKLKGKPDKLLDGAMVLSLFTMIFLWNYFTVSPLTSLAQALHTIFATFSSELYNTATSSRALVTPTSILTFASAINWVLFYAVHFFIVLGILSLLLQPGKMKLDLKYRIISIVSAVILFSCFVIPNLALQLRFSRFYALSLLFLAPCFVLGGNTLVNVLTAFLKRLTHQHFPKNTRIQIVPTLLCLLLVGYFLSQSGFINFVTEAPSLGISSLDFNRIITSNDESQRAQLYAAYIPEQNVFSAVWLSEHETGQSRVYADWDSSINVLLSYGMVPEQYATLLTNSTSPERHSFVYLSLLNVESDVIVSEGGVDVFNASEISSILNESNLIYSNGKGEIWYTILPG